MAKFNSDGSIILTTEVDTNGLKKGMSQMQNGLLKMGKLFGVVFSVTKLIQFSNESANLATQTEASIYRLIDIYGSASDKVGNFIDQNARALGMSKAAAASFSSVYGNLFSAFADQETNAQLTNKYLQMTAVIASKTGRTVEDVQERIRSGLLGNTEAIEDLGVFVNVKTIEMTDAFKRMANGKSWEQLDAYTQQQVRSLAILEQATAKYGDEVAETTASVRNRYNAAYRDFQNSWGNIVNTVLIPVLRVLTDIFNIATAGLNALSGRSGKILENTEDIVNASSETADNIKKQAENQKELNKEIKRTLAGFDDIEVLSSKAADNTSTGNKLDNMLQGIGGVGDSLDGSSYVDEVDKTLTAIMGIAGLALAAIGLILLFTGNISWGIGFLIAGAGTLLVTMATASKFDYNGIIQMLTTIMGFAGGALLALGIILLWIGGVVGIGVAIGMIVAGGMLIVSAIAAQAAFSPNDVDSWLSLIMGIAGGALLALGVILCMLGSVPIGVGLIIAGVASIVSAVAINSDAVVEAIQGPLGAIVAIVGGVLLVIGLILVCTGTALPLGIALIAAGAAGLAAVTALNKDTIVNWIKNAIFENAVLISLISGGLLIIGIILCAMGVMLPLGIALIAAGAAGLAAVTALNKDAIVNWIKNAIFENSELIAMISGGLLILGIILCATGVMLPLGIALIAAGAVGLVTVTALNKDTIVNWIRDSWNSVKRFWNTYIAPVFTTQWWLNLGKKAINGLISGFEGGINGIISGFESMINWVVDGLNKISFSLPDWIPGIGGKTFGINIPRAYLGRVRIPRLAQGAVIPPNREFLAVLGDQKQGTNIETPLATMIDAFKSALDSRDSEQPIQVHLYLDGKQIYDVVVNENRKNTRVTGNNALAY